MQKTLLFLLNLKEKNSPRDGHQMVDVDFILLEPLHTYYNNSFALETYTHSHSTLILNTHTSPIQ
jgi:hypothetical protein